MVMFRADRPLSRECACSELHRLVRSQEWCLPHDFVLPWGQRVITSALLMDKEESGQSIFGADLNLMYETEGEYA